MPKKSPSRGESAKAPSRTLSKKKKAIQPLPLEEWDFELLDNEDLPACYLWEYWREKCRRDPVVATTLANVQAEVRCNDAAILRHDQEELSLFKFLVTNDSELPRENHRMLEAYGDFYLYLWSPLNPLAMEMDGLANISPKYFPKKPFLSLDPCLRKIIVGKVTIKEAQGIAQPLREIGGGKRDPNIHHSGDTGIYSSPGNTTNATFSINWDHCDDRIREAFHDWLTHNRKVKATLTVGLGRGRSVDKDLRTALRTLAACRLLNYYGSQPAALAACLDAGKNYIYQDKSNWSKCKNLLDSSLDEFRVLSSVGGERLGY